MEIELIKLRNTLYEYIDWIAPKLSAFEQWLSDYWAQLHFDPRQIELAAL